MNSNQQFQPQSSPAPQNVQGNSVVQPRFSSKQLIIVMLLGLLFSFVLSGMVYVLNRSCDTDGYGFCDIGPHDGLLLLAFLPHVTAAVFMVFILRKFKVANYIQIVVLAELLLLLFPFATFFYLNPAVPIIMVGLLNAVAYGFFYWFFNALRFDPTNKLIVAVVIVILAMIGLMHLSDIAIDQQYEKEQYEKEQQSKIENDGFNLYRPTYVPAGYRIDNVWLSSSYDKDPAAHGQVSYLSAKNGINFSIYIFNDSKKRFNPPADCGPAYPRDISVSDFPCEEIGETPHGDKIYLHDSNPGNLYHTSERLTYVKIDNSIVTLPTRRRHFTNSDLIKIMGSLKPTTTKELWVLHEQDRKQ